LALLRRNSGLRFTARELADETSLWPVANALRGLSLKGKVGQAKLKVHDGEKAVRYYWAL
jgi:hypothetical protein